MTTKFNLFSLLAIQFAFVLCSCNTEAEFDPRIPTTVRVADIGVTSGDDGEVSYENQLYFDLDQPAVDPTKLNQVADDNYVHFSIEKDVTVSDAMPGWDIVLTNYHVQDVEMGPGSIYVVNATGALINTTSMTKAVKITKEDAQEDFVPFADMTLEQAEALSLQENVDAIGYDWKSVNTDTGLYTMVADTYYVIKTEQGKFYKLAFTSFYGEKGTDIKGTTVFTYEELD
ncbi:HmuY family protein [Persicobacter psychrovividus]|uniref:HmuY protein n=1 Tax=Persicobacter psychrovividus TaxID=387638 RepID=A0ABM7VHX5_9BACT|nr:hypothetical protein PEPS_28350 [Persicobacter psychrovividus]